LRKPEPQAEPAKAPERVPWWQRLLGHTQPAFWRLPYGEPVWVEIPAGEFWMGSDKGDDEKPLHKVYLERFWIAKVPVTNAQYQLFVLTQRRKGRKEMIKCAPGDPWLPYAPGGLRNPAAL